MRLNICIYPKIGKLFIVEAVIYITHSMLSERWSCLFSFGYFKVVFQNLIRQSQGVQDVGRSRPRIRNLRLTHI